MTEPFDTQPVRRQLMRRMLFAAVALASAPVFGCAADPIGGTSVTAVGRVILASSNPKPGSIVSGPVNQLALHFDPPARLDEVSITGPDGTMPTKIHSVGEVTDYSLPLGGLGPGSYRVDWRATSGGEGYRGSFSFKVK